MDTHGGKEHLLILASPERQVEFERELSALATPRMDTEVAELDGSATERLVRGLGRLLEAPELPEGTDARRLFELARELGAGAEVVDGVWFRHVELANPAP